MDVIVTTPKTQMAAAAAEAADAIAAGGGEYFRRFAMNSAPMIYPGERVYYVEDGYIRGFAYVSRVEHCCTGEQRSKTGRRWPPGTYLYMFADSWQWIRPMPMVGFQNFHYAWSHFRPEDVLIVGGWRDAKPCTPQTSTLTPAVEASP